MTGRRTAMAGWLVAGAPLLPTAAVLATAAATSQLLRPPAVRGPAIATDRFSAARAAELLAEIASEPRPIGSPGNARARQLLTAKLRELGLQVEIQQSVATTDLGRAQYGVNYRAAGRVHNIVARLPGRSPGPPLLVMTHYDSVEQGAGAGDAGMLVAALLESLRAVRAGPPLATDLIVVITDGEEVGLLGARAFFQEHPAAPTVRAVLNFEARGTAGPALMFETGPGSGDLIGRLAELPSAAIASSLFDEAYQRMPNTTDFALAKEFRLPGLNFANIGKFVHYHGPDDSVEQVDRRTLQHHGENMLGLLRGLSEPGATTPAGPDRVFFSLGRGLIVHYPARAALPLALGAAAAATAGLLTRRPPSGARWLSGGVALRQLGRLLAGAGAGTALIQLLGTRSEYFRRHGDFADSDQVYAALAGLAATLTLAGDRTQVADPWQRLGNTVLPLAAAGVGLAARMPGASYLPNWPLAATAGALATAQSRPAVRGLGSAVVAATGTALLVPLSRLLYQGLTPRAAAAPMAALQLCGELAAPALWALPRPVRRVLAAGCLAVTVAVAGRQLLAAPGAQPETLSYLLDADAGRALYFSSDARTSDWTARYLGRQPGRGRLAGYFPGWRRDFLFAPAEPVELAAPVVEVLRDEPGPNGGRSVTLRVVSARDATLLSLALPAGGVRGWSVAGRPAPADPAPADRSTWELLLYAPGPEGLRVDLELDLGPARLRVLDRSAGLPDAVTKPAFRPVRPAAALDVDTWGNGTYVSRWIAI